AYREAHGFQAGGEEAFDFPVLFPDALRGDQSDSLAAAVLQLLHDAFEIDQGIPHHLDFPDGKAVEPISIRSADYNAYNNLQSSGDDRVLEVRGGLQVLLGGAVVVVEDELDALLTESRAEQVAQGEGEGQVGEGEGIGGLRHVDAHAKDFAVLVGDKH